MVDKKPKLLRIILKHVIEKIRRSENYWCRIELITVNEPIDAEDQNKNSAINCERLLSQAVLTTIIFYHKKFEVLFYYEDQPIFTDYWSISDLSKQ